MAKWVISHFPEHRQYVEPFGGAASVLMQKTRSEYEVYNDLDDEVVNLFRILRDREKSLQLIESLKLTPWARAEFFSCYEDSTDLMERARKFVARSFMGFSTTGRRKNQTGFRGKPIRDNGTGVKDWLNYPESLKLVVERLQGVVIENQNALDLIPRHDHKDTLFYVDPPYVHSTRTSLRYPSQNDRCYAHEMTDEDHRKLGEILLELKGMVIVSGYPSALYDEEIYKNWTRYERKSYADGARERTEVLWLNASAEQRRFQFQPSLLMN